jgi:hypothetical protein
MAEVFFLAVAGDRVVAHHRQPDPQGLERREAAGIFDQGVAGRHELRHAVRPSEDDGPAGDLGGDLAEAGRQRLVPTADDDRHEAAGGGDQPEGVGHAPDTPRAGHDQHGPVAGVEAELAPGPFPCLGTGRPDRVVGLADERTAGNRRSARVPSGVVGRARVYGEIEVHAPVDPEGVHPEVGDEVDGRDPQSADGAQTTEAEGGERVGRHDDVDLLPPDPPHHPPAGEQTDKPGDHRAEPRHPVPEPVGRVIGRRGVFELELVAPT